MRESNKQKEELDKEFEEVMEMVGGGNKKRGRLLEAMVIGGIVLCAIIIGCSSNKSSKGETKGLQSAVNTQLAVGIESNEQTKEELQFQNDYLVDGTKQTEGGLITEIERYVLDVYKTHNFFDETSDFIEAEDAADEALYAAGSELGFLNYDLFYQTQDEAPNVFVVKEVKLVDDNHAYVEVKLTWSEFGDYNKTDSIGLVMVRDLKEGKQIWLVDDVIEFGEYGGSVKSRMIYCARRYNDDSEIISSVGAEEDE